MPEILTFDEVVSVACSKELDLKNSRKILRRIVEGLMVSGKNSKRFDRRRTSERSDRSNKFQYKEKSKFKPKPKKT